MNILSSIRDIFRHLYIIIYPIVFDIIALLIGISLIGLQGRKTESANLILEMGIPSVSHIANFPTFVNHVNFLNLQEKVSVLMILIVIFMLIVRSFLQGGYIQNLYHIELKSPFSFSHFIQYGKRSWVQLFFLEIIIFLVKIAALTFFVMVFNVIIGQFASLGFLIFLRIVYIYLEMTMVVDHVNIPKGLRRSWGYLKDSFFPSFPLIFVMFVVAGSISFVLHKYWSIYFIFFIIGFYALVMTIIQMAFVKILHHVKTDRYY